MIVCQDPRRIRHSSRRKSLANWNRISQELSRPRMERQLHKITQLNLMNEISILSNDPECFPSADIYRFTLVKYLKFCQLSRIHQAVRAEIFPFDTDSFKSETLFYNNINKIVNTPIKINSNFAIFTCTSGNSCFVLRMDLILNR